MKESSEESPYHNKPFDTRRLQGEILGAASTVLEKDIRMVKGFSASQISKMVTLSAKIHVAVLSGKVTKDLGDFFKQSLEKMVRNFVYTMKQLVPIILEKMRVAVLNVIFNFIEKSTGGALRSAFGI